MWVVRKVRVRTCSSSLRCDQADICSLRCRLVVMAGCHHSILANSIGRRLRTLLHDLTSRFSVRVRRVRVVSSRIRVLISTSPGRSVSSVVGNLGNISTQVLFVRRPRVGRGL